MILRQDTAVTAVHEDRQIGKTSASMQIQQKSKQCSISSRLISVQTYTRKHLEQRQSSTKKRPKTILSLSYPLQAEAARADLMTN